MTLLGTLCGFGLLNAGPVVERRDQLTATGEPRPPERRDSVRVERDGPDGAARVIGTNDDIVQPGPITGDRWALRKRR